MVNYIESYKDSSHALSTQSGYSSVALRPIKARSSLLEVYLQVSKLSQRTARSRTTPLTTTTPTRTQQSASNMPSEHHSSSRRTRTHHTSGGQSTLAPPHAGSSSKMTPTVLSHHNNAQSSSSKPPSAMSRYVKDNDIKELDTHRSRSSHSRRSSSSQAPSVAPSSSSQRTVKQSDYDGRSRRSSVSTARAPPLPPPQPSVSRRSSQSRSNSRAMVPAMAPSICPSDSVSNVTSRRGSTVSRTPTNMQMTRRPYVVPSSGMSRAPTDMQMSRRPSSSLASELARSSARADYGSSLSRGSGAFDRSSYGGDLVRSSGGSSGSVRITTSVTISQTIEVGGSSSRNGGRPYHPYAAEDGYIAVYEI
ncbi:hypothetical protein LTR37_018976 [Vermiconidia calcicola]|uniref:Uncharacterized protein n=1 Tax=Vermiconidia calcicola TaxID=1690605 RepID=A0ACC3MFH3_9PEZI|nr:hypothetical protein LTR37_018976 [Vermiconidia calcicola]